MVVVGNLLMGHTCLLERTVSLDFKEIAKDIFYITEVFPNCDEFISEIEKNDNNEKIYEVIPKWEIWQEYLSEQKLDGTFENIINEGRLSNGFKKVFKWDNKKTYDTWPKTFIDLNYSESHKLAYPIIEMFEPHFKKFLESWCLLNNKENFDYITRNYCIKKYVAGGQLTKHIDINENDPVNTQDWTVLIYLNDNYDGGEIFFTFKDGTEIFIKPEKGSALIFPTSQEHWVDNIIDGNKYFMFFYLHSMYKTCVAMEEKFLNMHRLKINENTKQRKLLDGKTVKSYDKPIDLIIHTKAPAKWKIIDMETGEEYIGNEMAYGAFSESLRKKIKTSLIGSWLKIKHKSDGV